jgi:hypothetical protein
MSQVSVKLLYVLMLAQNGASLFTGIVASDRIRRGCAYQGRCTTVRSALNKGLIDKDNNLTTAGEEVLKAEMLKRQNKRTWVRPEKAHTYTFHQGKARRVS